MAEGLLRRKLVQVGQADRLTVASAGVWAVEGEPATQHAVQAVAERGMDISGHRSQGVTEENVAGAALILTMTRNQAEAIRAEFPSHARRVHLLSEMSGQAHDVQDPIGGPLSEYRTTAGEIERLIEAGCEKIVELASCAP